MERRLPAQKHLRVRTKDGVVVIESSDSGSTHGSWDTVAVSPERVPLLVQWLQDAAAELAASEV
ncbi:MAG: hypothetical protein ACRC8S_14265 [Fimbriiglobus sp.]